MRLKWPHYRCRGNVGGVQAKAKPCSSSVKRCRRTLGSGKMKLSPPDVRRIHSCNAADVIESIPGTWKSECSVCTHLECESECRGLLAHGCAQECWWTTQREDVQAKIGARTLKIPREWCAGSCEERTEECLRGEGVFCRKMMIWRCT